MEGMDCTDAPERILIVEDDGDICRMLARILNGYELRTERDGWSAIDAFTHAAPDAIVTDLMLPGIGGLGVLAAARESLPLTPVLLITAYASLPTAIEALRMGAYDYIEKPFEDFDAVRRTVARALQARALGLENLRILEDLRQANSFKADLLRTVSHDLNNLLLSVSGNVELARAMGASDAADECLQCALQGSLRMQTLLHDLSTFGRIDARALSLRCEYFSLRRCIHEAAELLAYNPMTHRLDLPEDAPDAYGDETRTLQIISNLLSNAVKYSPAGGVVSVQARRVEEVVEVTVRDDGIGIPGEALDSMFTRFQRVERAAISGIPGSGLGLYIVKSLVELQGGTVTLDSREGQGCAVTFTLPASAAVDLETRVRG